MDSGVLAAIRRLPRHKKAIEELALFSRSFRSLCGDLVEAEVALLRWEGSQAPGTTARCAEYRLLIKGLEAELLQTIHERWGQSGGRNEV